MTRPIPIALQVRGKERRLVQIIPHWAGKGLAVHLPVITYDNGKPVFDNSCSDIWVLTHIHTGMSAKMFYGNLERAIAFARQWDDAFAAVTTSKVPQLLRRNYVAALAVASEGPSKADIIEAGG